MCHWWWLSHFSPPIIGVQLDTKTWRFWLSHAVQKTLVKLKEKYKKKKENLDHKKKETIESASFYRQTPRPFASRA